MYARSLFLTISSGLGFYGYWSVSGGKGEEKQYNTITSDIPLLLVPGLKGSQLIHSQTNELYFLTPKQSLSSFFNKPLDLPLEWNEEKNKQKKSEVVVRNSNQWLQKFKKNRLIILGIFFEHTKTNLSEETLLNPFVL